MILNSETVQATDRVEALSMLEQGRSQPDLAAAGVHIEVEAGVALPDNAVFNLIERCLGTVERRDVTKSSLMTKAIH